MIDTVPHSEASGANQVPEGYITIEEVAQRLKKTPRTVRNWQKRRVIPFIKIGRSVLFRWREIEAHLEQNFRVLPKTK
jgi:excisionase family DNA binding protein